jgi:uncharacterized protein YdhG (YjbR/CyaY superfamily)
MSIINDYLKTVPEPQRTKLEVVRQIILKAAPTAEETITYGMPGYKYNGKYLISFAAFKDHMSIFPGAEPIEVLKDELKDFKISKGTIQFTLDKPIPDPLLERVVRLCVDRNSKK